MGRLSCLLGYFVSFWALGAAPVALAQDEEPSDAAALVVERPGETDVKILRSSRSGAPSIISVDTNDIPAQPTRILDSQGADRLMRNEGVSLQWINWEERGGAWVMETTGGHWLLLAGQRATNGAMLDVEGFITEIGRDYFVLEGTVKIFGTPDGDRQCNATKSWRFEVTQNRSYYRLREFEWCDNLTDYIDIYFPTSMR